MRYSHNPNQSRSTKRHKTHKRFCEHVHAFCACLWLFVALVFCTVTVAQTTHDSAATLARTVTIYRDTYGVPHVFGRTDASTVFGFAYAQAEDNFWRVEENFIHALGRASELYGERALEEDRLNRALEIDRKSVV